MSAPAAGAVPYVLNLCSSSTPMALAQTDLPELKRFTFFVSRRFEEGRERFRLHMGYFATLAEAEEWLSVVREIYPGAWAGEAPGRKLRERAAAAAAAQAQHAAGPQPRRGPPPKRAAVAAAPAGAAASRQLAPPRTGVMPSPGRVPVVHAAPPRALRATPAVVRPVAKSAAVTPTRAPRGDLSPLERAMRRLSPPPVVHAPPAAPAPRAAAPARAQPARAHSAAAHPSAKGPSGAFGDSNVREVLAALGDSSATGETRRMRAPPPPRATPVGSDTLSDTAVLRMLESRRPAGAEPVPADAPHGGIPLLKPDDTGTRLALREAVVNNAPVAFAVQLQWSVQPADLSKVPPLAIFGAYTLYTVEGSRDGRKWYGLRLGFFSDAISAKQVAHYVRSEFASVAVVPVSSHEKARASSQTIKAARALAPAASRSQPQDEFKLIEDDTAKKAVASLLSRKPAVPTRSLKTPPKAAGRAAMRQPASPAGSARARVRGGAKVAAREHRSPQTLEETLEILGASQLSIDESSGETLNDSGVRHLRVEVQKDSPFSKLLERLSERMRKV